MTIVAVFFVVAFVSGVLISRYPHAILSYIPGVAGWIGLILQFVYGRWDKFYLAVQSIRTMFYPDTLWSMSVRYGVSIQDETDVSSLGNAILTRLGTESTKVTRITPSIHEYRHAGMVIQTIASSGEEFEVHLLDLPVSRNKTVDTLETVIDPLLTSIETILKPQSKKYFFTVHFDGENNPYYGLYLRRLSGRQVTSFNVTFNVQHGRVELYKGHVTIISQTFGQMLQLSKKYVLLSLS